MVMYFEFMLDQFTGNVFQMFFLSWIKASAKCTNVLCFVQHVNFFFKEYYNSLVKDCLKILTQKKYLTAK